MLRYGFSNIIIDLNFEASLKKITTQAGSRIFETISNIKVFFLYKSLPRNLFLQKRMVGEVLYILLTDPV